MTGYSVLCAACGWEFGVYEDTKGIPDNPECPCLKIERVEVTAGEHAASRLRAQALLELAGREGLIRGRAEERP